MMNTLVKHIWLVSLQCLMVELVSLESTTSVPGFTSEFPLNLIGFCKGAQRNIVLKMSCVIGEIYTNISSVVEFQRGWVLKSKVFGQESTYSKDFF